MSGKVATTQPRPKRFFEARRLVLVDIENVVGGSERLTPEVVHRVQRVLESILSIAEQDQVILASGTRAFPAVGFEWTGPRHLVRAGIDGADSALLEVLTEERVAERFDEVVLVSGDGVFADAVAQLGTEGVLVTVCSRIESCSARLQMAAGSTVFLALDVGISGGAA